MYFVYIMTNKTNSTLYIGFTSDLRRRVYEHREGLGDGFTKKYNLIKLVYYESGESRDGVLQREKEMKKWNRIKKERNISAFNSHWRDLYDTLC
jgi:putative endonuclease